MASSRCLIRPCGTIYGYVLCCCIYGYMLCFSDGAGPVPGLPSSVPLGTTFNTSEHFWMQSRNERFQVDLRCWIDAGVDQCMGGVRYTYKTPNALIWAFHRTLAPLNGSYFTLSLRSDGVLELELTDKASSSRFVAWQSPTAGLRVQNLTLQDDGNLVLINDSGHIVWQSFEYYHDLFLISSGLRFGSGYTLYDRVHLYTDFSTAGCYALRMGSQGHLEMFTRANSYVYYRIGINATAISQGAVPEYVVIHQDIEFYSSQGTLVGAVAHNIFTDDPLPSGINLTGSALFKNGNLVINRPQEAIPNRHLEYYNSPISGYCDFPLVCGEYGLCNEATKSCSCPPGFQITSSNKPSCTAHDEPTRKCSCPRQYKMPIFNNTCIPVDPAYSLRPIKVSFPAQPSSVEVISQDECRNLCEKNISCNAALFDSATMSCALFPILYTVSLPLEDTATEQVMFLKIKPVTGRRFGSRVALIVGTTIGMAAVVLSLVIMVIWRRRSTRHVCMPTLDGFFQELSRLPPRLSYKELQICTNNFSKGLGKGGFGTVYEGVLKTSTGFVKVAVKRIEEKGDSTQNSRDHRFKAEVATIGSVSHVNLVALKGFCMEKNVRLLVFEFMPKGSLDSWLFEPLPEENISFTHTSSHKPLDWATRCRIALDTAMGLKHLHHESAEHIVHCDVKPANILLDENFHAKVGDFGLAKLTGTDSQSFAITTFKGTRGYLAPEWLHNTTITAKSDVYSYGVVLLELLTGRRSFGVEHEHLPVWVMKTIRGTQPTSPEDIFRALPAVAYSASNAAMEFENMDSSTIQRKIMDSRLPCDGSIPSEVFYRMLVVALACVQTDPVDRPSMISVVRMLEDILKVTNFELALKLGHVYRLTLGGILPHSLSDVASSSMSGSSSSDLHLLNAESWSCKT